MNKLLSLTKVLLKNGGESLFSSKNKKKLSKTAILILLIIAVFIPIAVSFVLIASKAYDSLRVIEQQGFIIGLALSVACFVIFFFGIFYTMNTFYFSMDIENLLPLPLKPSEILGAKFIVVLVYEYYTEAVFLLPVLLTYGIKDGSGILYYIYILITFLILPVVPLLAASIIVMVIMRFTNVGKNKDLFKVIGGLFGIFFGLGINFYIQRINEASMSQDKLMQLVSQGNNSLMNIASILFPSSKYAVNGVVRNNSIIGFENILLFVIITAIAFIIFMCLGNLLYFKGVVGISETTSKRKKLTSRELSQSTRMNSVLRSYTIKELRILFRTPIYFLNCIIMNFLWPIFLIFPFLFQQKASQQLGTFIAYFQRDSVSGIVLASSFATGLFITASNMITSTAISREGKNIYVMKYIPVNYTLQVMAKVLSGVIMGIVGITMMLIAAVILFKFSFLMILLMALAGILGAILSALSGILIDLYLPKLNWDSEQKAVKQNMNGLISMGASVVIGGLSVFAAIKLQLGLWTAFIMVIVVALLINILLYSLVASKGVKALENIEG